MAFALSNMLTKIFFYIISQFLNKNKLPIDVGFRSVGIFEVHENDVFLFEE